MSQDVMELNRLSGWKCMPSWRRSPRCSAPARWSIRRALSPNSAVCPVCSGMPGTLPVINRRAVEYAPASCAGAGMRDRRDQHFRPEELFLPGPAEGLPDLAVRTAAGRNGRLVIRTSEGERLVRIRRVHLEEDTGKLTHVIEDGPAYSLVDLNRAGVPLLEIVSEPDLHSPEEVRALCSCAAHAAALSGGQLRQYGERRPAD